MNKEKVFTIIRYVFAIPAGVLAYILCDLVLLFLMRLPENQTYGDIVMKFVWVEFINIIAFFCVLNYTLPKYKFVISVVLASIIGTLLLILLVMNYYYGLITVKVIIALILNYSALIMSCSMSYKGTFDEFINSIKGG